MSPRRLQLLTTGRADWNILAPVARALQADPEFDLGLIVTGGHLDPAQGLTVAAVEATGLTVSARIAWGEGTAASRASRVLEGVATALTNDPPDMLILLGDRFETLAAAQGAGVGVPLTHLSGGDVTEGAIDDGFRHAITKLSHLHLAFHEPAARRLRQMGEAADRVHVVGNPALDGLVEAATMTDAELERRLGAALGARNLLVTFHPVTLQPDHGQGELEALLTALDRLEAGWSIWITQPNADPGGEVIRDRIHRWAEGREWVHVCTALSEAYPALAARCRAVMGNSSSGLAEVPTLGVPTVDVGLRQSGRLAGPSVVWSEADPEAILAALVAAQALGPDAMINPYGDGGAIPRILPILRTAPSREVLLRKPFVDLEPAHV